MLKQVPVNSILYQGLAQEGSQWVKAFNGPDGMKILFSMDKTHHGFLLHASISRPDRYPSWDDLIQVKDQLFGDVDCMMIMPKKVDYVNFAKTCFHIWKTPVGWDIQ